MRPSLPEPTLPGCPWGSDGRFQPGFRGSQTWGTAPRHTQGSGTATPVAEKGWLDQLEPWEQQECPAEGWQEVIPGPDLVQVSQPEPGSHFIPSVWSVGCVTVGK